MNKLPETGYLRLIQIIGRSELTTDQANDNRDEDRYPRTPRSGITPIIPVSKTAWWQGVKEGRYPAPVKLGPKTTVWRVEDIRALIAAA